MSVSIVVGIIGMLLWIALTIVMASRSGSRPTRRRASTLAGRRQSPKMLRGWFRLR